MDETRIRSYILTRFELSFTINQIHKELCAAWGHGSVFYSTVAEWLQRFRQGRTSLKDVLRIGRPIIAVTDENIDTVRMLVEENPHISIRYIAWKLAVLHETVGSIIHEELKMCTMSLTSTKRRVQKTSNENLPRESSQIRIGSINGDSVILSHKVKHGFIIVLSILDCLSSNVGEKRKC